MTEPDGLAAFTAALDLDETGPDAYRGRNTGAGQGVIFGGQLLAQSIAAAARAHGDKRVKSLHTVFARGGSLDEPVDITVERMHAGRAFASVTVSIAQGDRLCARSLVLLDAPEPDLIRHGPPMPDVAGPDAAAVGGSPADGSGWWDVRVVGGVDLSDPEAVGPAELNVWTRFPDAPDDEVTGQGLLAWASDGFLIGTAMRPHAGVGQAMAHVSISTSVITHTLTFHEPFRASDWLLLSQESPYAGRGRAFGRAHVFAADGRVVASFSQESMIRDFPAGRAPGPGARSRH